MSWIKARGFFLYLILGCILLPLICIIVWSTLRIGMGHGPQSKEEGLTLLYFLALPFSLFQDRESGLIFPALFNIWHLTILGTVLIEKHLKELKYPSTTKAKKDQP